MTRLLLRLAFPLALACFILPAPLLRGQLPEGVTREQMWRAPTAEEWKKPCLINWQRTWEDAVAISKETGKPILICINMDGEIASEHYAGIRYRQPEITKLYEPYVTVIASVYRHRPSDHDEHGHRLPCPRFGGVTCGEHIAIEPFLFEKFMDGKRIAPRHIMIELDGKETYDVFYAWDTDSVFKAVSDGITNRDQSLLKNVVRGDRSIIERVASKDSTDRRAVEKAYRGGDKSLRKALLDAAAACGKDVPVDVLRLAVSGFDVELQKLARQALAGADSTQAIDLISHALSVPMNKEEREGLVQALARMGEHSVRARGLAVVHRGLDRNSNKIDVQGWSTGLSGGATYAPATTEAVVTERLQNQDHVYSTRDAGAHVELAEAFLRRAQEADPRSSFTSALFLDARAAARKAEELGATGWRVNAVLALCALQFGETEEAEERAKKAVGSLPESPDGWNAMAVLELFVGARQKAISKAVRSKQDWPEQWLTDVHATYSVLARHPHGNDLQVVRHYEFLEWLAARRQAGRVLDDGLKRFPDSWRLHLRLRNRTLRNQGVDALEETYARMLRERDKEAKNLEWFAGYASLMAAEFHRRAGSDAKATEAYGRGLAFFEKSIQASPDLRETAEHFIALGLGGRARIAFEADDDPGALADIVASFERKPEAAAVLDGLNISTVDTAKMLLTRLKKTNKQELAKKLEDAMGRLDPKALELPAYERGGAPSRNDGGSGQGSNRGQGGNNRGNRPRRSLLRFDRDGDGKVQGSELPDVLRKRLLDRYDKNRDGTLDLQEMPNNSGGSSTGGR